MASVDETEAAVAAAMIPVGWLAPAQECWDSNMLRRLLDGDLYPHGLKVRHFAGYPNTDDPVVIIVPGRYYAQHTDQINLAIQRFVSVLMVVTSDEEATLDIGEIVHSRARFWVQTPRTDRDYGDARLFGIGYTPHFNSLPSDPPDKTTDVYLSGQNTHGRRKECFEALESWDGDKLVRPTEGFTEGFEPQEYVQGVVSAKVCPAPSGAVSPDTFRFWESLEAHAIPIADDISPAYESAGFWERLLPGAPFPILTKYSDLNGYIDTALEGWPATANRIAAFYMRYKRSLALGLREDLRELGAV